jgi:predicted enzyme related to lactoylglutathione lyase
MGQPVVHFEVIGKEAERLQRFYADLFDWKIDADNPLGYGVVEGAGIGGGIGPSPGSDTAGHVTFYVQVPDVETALADAATLGGNRVFGPEAVPGTGIVLGQFTDPEGHLIGLMQAR